ncbi:hypothetical protein F53441_8098 [Fusarium austroafricanum]|uniref:Uncharacterized protein n=1 Tax=Fusarium austroafricanum TaxID=2364996 RepID=A0A8H4KDM4_9HYPO|nr:hypothetical protein F53441_8098 [Fusarium austroafricanum]
MSDYDSFDQVIPSTPALTMNPRRTQQGKLALLPAEILFEITGEPGEHGWILSRQDLKNLALSCSSLFYFTRPVFYAADNFIIFRNAVRHADVEVMERCEAVGGTTDTQWAVSCQCQHEYHWPIDDLVECTFLGSASIDKCIEALQWLLQRSYKANDHECQVRDSHNETCSHMPELLITTLYQSRDRARVKGVCEMIWLLHNHGYSLPFYINRSKISRIRCPVKKADPFLIRKPMDVALRSCCPPSFLEVLLQEWHNHVSDPGRAGSRITDFRLQQTTHLGNMAWGLFLDLLDPSTSWKEAYLGEAVDIFQRKIDLLIEYHAVDSEEIQYFQSILEALQDISRTADPLGGFDRDRDEKECWQRLCDALRLCDSNQGRAEEDTSILTNHQSSIRIHRFILPFGWLPWGLWFNHELQKPKFRAEMSYVWMKHPMWRLVKEKDGPWHDSEWHRLFESDATMRRLPYWSETSYEEFLAAAEKAWLWLEDFERRNAEQMLIRSRHWERICVSIVEEESRTE